VNIISNASLKPQEILVETNKHTYTHGKKEEEEEEERKN
jgi:hypothetical protein